MNWGTLVSLIACYVAFQLGVNHGEYRKQEELVEVLVKNDIVRRFIDTNEGYLHDSAEVFVDLWEELSEVD